MKYFKQWTLFSITATVILISCGLALAADQGSASDATLTGLKSIYLRVLPRDPTLSKEVQMIREIEKNTMNQVRRAGLEILDQAKFEKLRFSHSYPMALMALSMQLIDIGDPDKAVLFVDLVISQRVLLPRKPVKRIWAPTWERRIVTVYRDIETINRVSKDIVRDFIEAYSSVN